MLLCYATSDVLTTALTACPEDLSPTEVPGWYRRDNDYYTRTETVCRDCRDHTYYMHDYQCYYMHPCDWDIRVQYDTCGRTTLIGAGFSLMFLVIALVVARSELKAMRSTRPVDDLERRLLGGSE